MELIIERLQVGYLEDAIRIAVEVFTYEQNIPEELINIDEELKPIWWCAKMDGEVIGIAAGWMEENKWHWGRFAVSKKFRGLGIGKKLAIFSLSEIFKIGAEKIYSEARDVTVNMLEQFGCKVVGKAINFYGSPVTPITITKWDFQSSIAKKQIIYGEK